MKIYQNSNEPIYKQIAAQLKEQILTGKLKSGDPLPSIRGLAQDLKISVITTMKAYEELSAEGLVTASKGKGYYVNAQDENMLKEQHMRQVEIKSKRSDTMEYESKKIARKKYREANATISVTVSKDIKQMLDDMSLAENKSKAALINEMIMDRYNQQNNGK